MSKTKSFPVELSAVPGTGIVFSRLTAPRSARPSLSPLHASVATGSKFAATASAKAVDQGCFLRIANLYETSLVYGFGTREDRKSTRLNSSHRCISYAVFCLKEINVSQDLVT